MKKFLLVLGAQEGFLVKGVTDRAEAMLNTLLESNCFDCVISAVHRGCPDSGHTFFSGWHKPLTEQEQAVTAAVSAHTDQYICKTAYSAYSDTLAALLKKENGGILPECVFISGFDLERDVLKTACDFFENGIRPIVLTGYCGTSGGEESTFAGTNVLKRLIGAGNICSETVRTPGDLDRLLEPVRESRPAASGVTEKKARLLVDLLFRKGWRISFAESCTGGKAAAGIVDIASASTVFDASFVTYANHAKTDLLGVSPDTIQKYGVVSEPVAAEMAAGAAKRAAAQVGVGISGIAGPGGGTPTKPVGTVCFGFCINGVTHTETVHFGSIGRNVVRQASVDFVYTTLLKHLSAI